MLYTFSIINLICINLRFFNLIFQISKVSKVLIKFLYYFVEREYSSLNYLYIKNSDLYFFWQN